MSDGPSRRTALALLGGGALALAGCKPKDWYGTDVAGTLPDLRFSLGRARDGKVMTQDDLHGQVVALFFGYTYCPDICPLTMANMAALTDTLGGDAARLSVLFVTVDPERDTPAALSQFVAAFTPRAAGLIGTPDQLADVTRRYRVTYKVAAHAPGETDYAVSHGKTVYVFDGQGKARVIWTEFADASADIAGAAGDVRRIAAMT